MKTIQRLETNTDDRWQAVQARDAGCDGQFVYAVNSTGIFCRPSCPSRRPGRERVEFFDTPALAERAGYRPCQRCRPGAMSKVDEFKKFLDGQCDARTALDEFSERSGLGPQHLRRLFKQSTGVTPDQYMRARRVERLKSHLRDNGESSGVTSAMLAAGYGSSSRLYERAGQTLGMTPATYRDGGKGAVITYEVIDSPLGKLLVAATARGVCAVKLGDSARSLIHDLNAEFPAAVISAGKVPLISRVSKLLEGRPSKENVPLDIRGTGFQRTVWAALCAIPSGQTRSYKQLAESIGKPTAVRAVARACATNPVAVVVPCHRVVRGNGDLSGYRWGVSRKRALLKRESVTHEVRLSDTSRRTRKTSPAQSPGRRG